MQRLLIVIGSLERGGAERHLAQVLPQLVRQGYDVEVYCLMQKGELAPGLEAAGVGVIGRNSRPKPGMRRLFALGLSALMLFFHLLMRRPHIVHFFLPSAYIIGAPIALLTFCRIKVMSRRSQNNYQHSSRWIGRAERLLHKCMDAVVGNSLPVVAQLRDEGVPEHKLHLLYNGVDAAAFANLPAKETVRGELRLDESALVLVIVANLLRYKGHSDLLEALAIAKPSLPDKWVLLCAGRDDGIGSRLVAQAEQLGLADHVRFLGPVTDIPRLLSAADIALLTSHEEGFSNAVIEYMAVGLPVIVTDVGGNAEAVDAGRAGIVVPPRQPAALAAAINRLAGNAGECQALGRAAQQRVAEHYSLEACVSGYRAIYNRLTGRAG
ncbi:glycosyltransferase [Ferrovibrio sp.]|uniref:glycosyltransferase n=1 Tax=Ferrovibrio sp. TaxID=1917215 RepID=UPI0026371EA6|nr:glycosyltransferase [Ferrovibrio sp.]